MRVFAVQKRVGLAPVGFMRAALVFLLLSLVPGGIVQASEFEFVVIGDTRPRFASQDFRLFEGLIGKINAAKPALIINLGDLIYGYGLHSKETQWDKYQQVIRAIEPPYYQVPGNHDTHSKQARRIYGRRFKSFYQSFDHEGWHFVLLDNTEKQRWGYLGPAQLEWLKGDLQAARARGVFVFLHFPVWEPERVTPEYYAFWEQTLHPLFKRYGVRAVFGGHYHAYGPTREFDGIRYYITGGGGAELRPEYKKSGGEHHFVRVKVSGDSFDTRVVTEHGELTDPEADVMGGLLFSARNVSRIGIPQGAQNLKAGVSFSVSVHNPYPTALNGQATWVLDASAFSVQPARVALQVPAGGKQQVTFSLKALKDNIPLPSLPRLQFSVAAGGYRHRFHRELRLIEKLRTPYQRVPPVLDGRLTDWDSIPTLKLGQDPKLGAEIRTCHDKGMLYVAITVPSRQSAGGGRTGFSRRPANRDGPPGR